MRSIVALALVVHCCVAAASFSALEEQVAAHESNIAELRS